MDQQLGPEQLTDEATSLRLSGLETLTKSSRELAEQYFIPALMAGAASSRRDPSAPPLTCEGRARRKTCS